MPAQSVVATRSWSTPSRFVRWAKNGSYAFFVSAGVGWSGPTPNRSLAGWADRGVGARSATHAAAPTRAERNERPIDELTCRSPWAVLGFAARAEPTINRMEKSAKYKSKRPIEIRRYDRR